MKKKKRRKGGSREGKRKRKGKARSKDKGNFGDFDKAEIEEAVKDKEGDEVEEISETKTKKLEISDEEELQPKSEARKAPEQTPA
ncbi:hypothetical protein JCGZ_12940 [Jatropha curcas]|uniref:Uncharacterized protein n=1 Tax=Jatropha curcas TaxID=180498 RepID=A0A067LDH3_JATCU|nr:hypothetical protein JCGZ_12940 [Jatropha curcas]